MLFASTSMHLRAWAARARVKLVKRQESIASTRGFFFHICQEATRSLKLQSEFSEGSWQESAPSQRSSGCVDVPDQEHFTDLSRQQRFFLGGWKGCFRPDFALANGILHMEHDLNDQGFV